MTQSFAVDVGGTFTDLACLDNETGEVTFAKAPTTPSEPATGVLAAVDRSALDLPGAEIFFHGTTLGINAMLEGKGSVTGVITTRGFRDVLELRRGDWPNYALHWDQPPPLVPRYLRREVTERLLADGSTLTPLDEDELRTEAQHLIDEGVEAIAVCFLHSYAHPQHERRAGEVLAESFPGVTVTLSHEVAQEFREYERSATAVSDAAIRPLMAGYLDSLQARLESQDFAGSFVVTRCDGGVMSVREAKQRPIRTLISGPASGVMGAATVSQWVGSPNVIACDMGGTSFDAALIIDHAPAISTSTQIGDVPLLMPVIELATIGAGGGSIAWLDDGGALRVGPHSAGAEPGPVCYGRGGAEPTFTDAAVVSGLLSADRFLGGDLALDVAAAAEAIRTQIAEPLGLSVQDAAAGIVELTEAKMASTLEELTVEKGHDPREFSLLTYGGGGSLVSGALAHRLGVTEVIIPPSPGTFSAWGMLCLDVLHDFGRTLVSGLETLAPGDLRETFGELELRAHEVLEREGIAAGDRTLHRFVDLRYQAQEHVLTIPVDDAVLNGATLDGLRAAFDERHRQVYGYKMDGGVEACAYRIRAVGALDKPVQPVLAAGGESSEHARTGTRSALHRESGGEFDWSVYDRDLLTAGNRLSGPAIVEEPSATTLVAPGSDLVVDTMGNLIISAPRED